MIAVKIALIGNPNCGKTTMYNALTGSTQYVGNWPGVTVEKKEGLIKGLGKDGVLVDLPGIYSLSPYSLEEKITRNFLIEEKPDAVINIVDATNMERSLYLTTQLAELGIPMVVALNMIDITERAGDKINEMQLAKDLGCRVVRTSATENIGLKELVAEVVDVVEKKERPVAGNSFEPAVENCISFISEAVKKEAEGMSPRWVGVNLFSRDPLLIKKLAPDKDKADLIENAITSCEEALGDDAESIIAGERYAYIDRILEDSLVRRRTGHLTVSDKIDRVVTNRLLGLPIFFLIMWGVYYFSIQTFGDLTIGWMEALFGDVIGGSVSGWLEEIGVADWLHGLIVDGIIGGVGAVMSFVPQLMVLFFFISILEDCGYMARVAFIMDRIFRQFGLSGKSFIPMLVGTGCSVPGIMATRTIENDMDRKLTIMLTPFIPCGAKLPVFALFVGTFFPTQSWVGPSMYIIGILMVIISGIVLKRTPMFAGDPAPFVMELPAYRIPLLKGVLIHMWERARAFMIKAGTIIFVAAGLIWLLQSFNWSFQMVEAEHSMLASIGNAIKFIFVPLGFGQWQSAMAVVTGFLAKEVVVATYGVLFGLGEVAEDNPNLITHISQMFTPVSAYSFMVFTLLASPCFAALGAIKSEMGSWKWTLFAMAWQTGLAYVLAMLIYQIGSRII
jgi:ferrous iron transport protein B